MEGPQSRLQVVGRACKIAVWLAVLPALSVPWAAPLLWASIMAGPFAGLWAAHDWGLADALGWATGCGLAIAAHPLRPNSMTGVVSAAGVGLWVLLGLVLTFQGV